MKIRKFEKKDLELLVVLAVVFVAMLLFAIFPYKDLFQEIVVSLVFLLIIPIAFIKLVLKRNLREFGFKAPSKNERAGDLFVAGCSFLIVIMLMFLIVKNTSFKESYYLASSNIKNNFLYLMAYELLAVNFFILLYEFFFRGFVMFYFAKRIGGYAIIFQFLIFLLFLDVTNQLNLSFVYYILIAPFAGLIAYRSNSLVYSYLFSIMSVIVGDLIFIKLTS